MALFLRGGQLKLVCAALLLSLGAGCAIFSGKTSAVLVKECVLPTDQAGTLAGKWRVTPVPIALQQTVDWSAEEVQAVTSAANTWNEFFTATQGHKVFDYGSSESPKVSADPVPGNLCSMGLLQGNAFRGSVVIYKQGKWPHPSGASTTMALTNFCTSPSSPLPLTYMAYMELNYQNFFIAGKKAPDLQTIVLHELGHLLGLQHSCEMNSKKPGMPNCVNSSLSVDYQEALMYPSFGWYDDGTGEQKRLLMSNDQGRANCLYPSTSKAGGG